ncbi:hypothetical protein [Bradyrhizobium tropiciagri]|uniref:hypothetical protein n=1 Tax=Bradyrhizobium tropiciagri TaxID=312253 RepID=UPI00067DC2AC|nr:hypothetical protein [Bradyrhizobium tropiciagri]
MGSKRRRVKQTLSLEERLARRANELRERALTLQPGTEKEALLKLARQAEIGAGMTEWLRASNLQSQT